MEHNRVFAGGNHLLILTGDGRLYGLMDNSTGAICPSGAQSYNQPYLMAENVVSAAASARCSLYVTGDGAVHLVGPCDFSGFSDGAEVWASMLCDTFWIQDRQGQLYCFGENYGPRGILKPWEKTVVRELPSEELRVSVSWGWSDLQDRMDSLEQRIREQEEFLQLRDELGHRNVGLELLSPGPVSVEKEHFYSSSWKETHPIQPVIYYVNNYYAVPILCPDQSYADTPHREGSAPLPRELRQKLLMYGDVRKALHIRGYSQFLLLLKDGSVSLADHRGNRVWENVFSEPVADLSWGNSCMIVSFCSGRISTGPAHTAYLRQLAEISLPAPPAADPLPSGVYGGERHFLLLDQGTLYGLGANDAGQLGGDCTELQLVPMAQNVVSAAASRNYSIYVTADGQVHLVGCGELTRLFPGFSGGSAVYAAQDRDVFYIVDRSGQAYVFGDNSDHRIQPEEQHVVLEFSDDSILEALCSDGWEDTGEYVPAGSRKEREFWTRVLSNSEAFRDAAERFGSSNLFFRHLDLHHPAGFYPHSTHFRRGMYPPTLFRTNALVFRPVLLAGEAARALADPLPCFMGCRPYALLPDGWQGEETLRSMPGVRRLEFNHRMKGLGLRPDGSLMVYNSWNGGFYAAYPRTPSAVRFALNGENHCLIHFSSGEYYWGSVEALEPYSPMKRQRLPLKRLENGELVYSSGDYW